MPLSGHVHGAAPPAPQALRPVDSTVPATPGKTRHIWEVSAFGPLTYDKGLRAPASRCVARIEWEAVLTPELLWVQQPEAGGAKALHQVLRLKGWCCRAGHGSPPDAPVPDPCTRPCLPVTHGLEQVCCLSGSQFPYLDGLAQWMD